MNVQTITMPQQEAEQQLRHYRKYLHAGADAEYRAIAEGYRALAGGTPLINLANVFATVPLDAFLRPKLAIARADRKLVTVRRNSDTRFTFDATRSSYPGRDLELTFEGPNTHGANRHGWRNGRSVVPLIPAEVLERVEAQRKLDRTRHFILFEVESWEDVPSDPFLIRHLGGPMYVVVAEWDLTELERTIIAGRRQ